MNGSLLEKGAVASDEALEETVGKVSKLSGKAALSWVSPDVLSHSLLAMVVSGTIYVPYHLASGGAPTMGKTLHTITGVVLGFLLIARIVVGLYAVSDAAHKVQAFSKACRSLAVLTSFVGETLTISAGAELEKKAVAKFRYELVRLLNLAVFTYHCMLKGLKMTSPPPSLKGGKNEAEILADHKNPTLMVCKKIATLIEQQRAAGRIGNEQVAAMVAKLDDVVDAYHGSLAQTLAPSPATLNAFSKFFVMLWVYTFAPVIALSELSENESVSMSSGLLLTLLYTLGSALFFFGLYEAGTLMEAPVKAVSQVVPLDDLKYTLSEDLATLVDDPEDSVPIFLTE